MTYSTSEKAAYNAGFNLTKKQAARREGVADAGGSAIERARQRALLGDQPVASKPAVSPSGPAKPSGKFIERPWCSIQLITVPKLEAIHFHPAIVVIVNDNK